MPALHLPARTLLYLLALLCSFSGGAGWAQDSAVTPGSRVRVWTALNDKGAPTGPRRTGFATAWTADSLVLDLAGAGGSWTIPITSVSRIDVNIPRSSGQGASRIGGMGLLIGAATGAVLGYLQGDDPPLFGDEPFPFSANQKAAIYGAMAGVAGGIAGAVIGTAWPGERWERASLPGRVSPAR